jgi:tetratricopeptide (TPR) repeat protein
VNKDTAIAPLRKIRFAVLLAVLLFAGVSCSRSNSDEVVFKNRVNALLFVPFPEDYGNPDSASYDKASQEHEKGVDKASAELIKFSEEFPGSPFADDARYLALIYKGIHGKVGDRAESIKMLEGMIKQYPGGKLEESTLKHLETLLKPAGGPFPDFYLPYDLKLLLLKGEQAVLKEKNYREGLKYYLEFIDNTNANNSRTRKLSSFAYAMVTICYKRLNMLEEGEALKNKRIGFFPEEKEAIEKSWAMPLRE